MLAFPKKVTKCAPLFMKIEKMTQVGPMWILGMPFFRHYYTTFDTASRTLYTAPTKADCTPLGGAGDNNAAASATAAFPAIGNQLIAETSHGGDPRQRTRQQ